MNVNRIPVSFLSYDSLAPVILLAGEAANLRRSEEVCRNTPACRIPLIHLEDRHVSDNLCNERVMMCGICRVKTHCLKKVKQAWQCVLIR